MRGVIGTVMALGLVGLLYSGIQNSKHDLTYSGNDIYTTDTDEICVFCHFPHSTNTTSYLWHHITSSASYQFYTSSTMNASTPTSTSGSTVYCLSCHDGTVSIGYTIYDTLTMIGTNPDGTMPAGPENVGTDLRDDHPISIQYEDGLYSSTNEDPDLRDRTTANTVVHSGYTLHLENEKVECGTCHDPHDNTNDPFLEAPVSNSTICFICHAK